MKGSFRAVLVASALLVPALASAEAAKQEGCTCTPRPAHAVDALPHYRAVFAGRVADVAETDAGQSVSFKVIRAWKGGRGKTMSVITPRDGCTTSLVAGQDYLVFATGTKESLAADACGVTDLGAAGAAVGQLNLNGGYGTAPLRIPAR